MGIIAREKVFRIGMVTATAVAMIAAAAPAALADTTPVPATKRIGSTPVVPHGAVRTANPGDDAGLDLSVMLSPRDPAGLQSFIAAVSNPASPQYHHYLKTGEFGPAFGPTKATVDLVRASLTAQGLTPGEVSSDGFSIPVHTTVGGAAQAFKTGFSGYRLPDGTAGLTNTAAPAVRGDIASAITGVVGLNTLGAVHPHHVKSKETVTAKAATGSSTVTPHAAGRTPQLCSGIVNGASGIGWYDTSQYWSAGSLAGAYGMTNRPIPTTGVTVALFELENYDPKDVTEYQACYGTSTSVTPIRVNGGPSQPADANTGVGGESVLDIEDIIGLVPEASILVYQGSDANSWTPVIDTYTKIITENRAQVISTSWGACEANIPSDVVNSESLLFKMAAAQGQTVVAASGDSGSTDCYHASGSPNSTVLNTDDPAGQPYVLSVGGTTMSGSGGSYETTWNHDSGATGGGISKWKLTDAENPQKGFTGPGYANNCSAATGETCRQVPDVAALGDPSTGYLIAYGRDAQGYEQWHRFGGTSGSAPTWAALIAQADLDLSCAADGPVGYVNPALYKLPSASFRDVTSGNNNLTISGNVSGLYQAGSGYDLATGLGSPNGRTIATALCKGLPEKPAGTFTTAGPTRVLDTRYAIGRAGTTPVAPNGTVPVDVMKVPGAPAAGVTAVVLNVTVTEPTQPGHLTAWPDKTTQPSSSNLNWAKGDSVPNLVTVPVGANGLVDLANVSTGTAHLIADVFGYYSTAPSGSTFTSAGPARLLDTRYATGVPTKTPVAPNGTVNVKVAGQQGVPATGVTAVVLNVTVTGPTLSGHLTAYPHGTAAPTSSNLNWVKGQTIANSVIVPVGADGTVDLANVSGGTTHLVADVFGYFSSSATGTKFHTAGPTRLLDTRSGIGTTGNGGPLGPDGTLTLDLNDGNVLANAKAVVLNVTVTGGTGDGFLTVWPNGTTRPNASNINWRMGQTIPNLVTVPVVNGKISFWNHANNVQVIADVFGYYS
ncbi:S53 family peptidase [Streptomyces sp. H10-C2]|uniref:S53 family peptidase n=1 Tax=unclassified Streptomyces TaxID=2593676 RepID=UPI0024B8E8A5|nr:MULTISPECIES: S53 family peptidase [unclassified Streptomyces]MDJ0340077.1 S53 family peptidase [Streptomyces sp. PH10-H1]MDJ0369286.1 S53 family peptidase [Streptomyces sp. H10-C2]